MEPDDRDPFEQLTENNRQEEFVEAMKEQDYTDKEVLKRVRNGTTTKFDYVYLATRLSVRC